MPPLTAYPPLAPSAGIAPTGVKSGNTDPKFGDKSPEFYFRIPTSPWPQLWLPYFKGSSETRQPHSLVILA